MNIDSVSLATVAIVLNVLISIVINILTSIPDSAKFKRLRGVIFVASFIVLIACVYVLHIINSRGGASQLSDFIYYASLASVALTLVCVLIFVCVYTKGKTWPGLVVGILCTGLLLYFNVYVYQWRLQTIVSLQEQSNGLRKRIGELEARKEEPIVTVVGSGTAIRLVTERLPDDGECDGFRRNTLDCGSLHAIDYMVRNFPRADIGVMSTRLKKLKSEQIVDYINKSPLHVVEVLLARGSINVVAPTRGPLSGELDKDKLAKVLKSSGASWSELGVSDRKWSLKPVRLYVPRGCSHASGTCQAVADVLLGGKVNDIILTPRMEIEPIDRMYEDVRGDELSLALISSFFSLPSDGSLRAVPVYGTNGSIVVEQNLWAYIPVDFVEERYEVQPRSRGILKCLLSKRTQDKLSREGGASMGSDAAALQRDWLGVNSDFVINKKRYRVESLADRNLSGVTVMYIGDLSAVPR